MTAPFNLIIAGVGGQGVYGLNRVLWRLCESAGLHCQGSVFKGGAQRQGGIHAVLRIFQASHRDYANYSSQVPPGELDLILGFEPAETLRYHAFFGSRTKIVCNTAVIRFVTERRPEFKSVDALQTLQGLGLPLLAKDYRRHQGAKRTNYLLGRDACAAGYLPFSVDAFDRAFADTFKPTGSRSASS